MNYPITSSTRIKRLPVRGHYDQETIYSILDEGTICHVGIAPEGRPIVIPTIYARVDNDVVLHGAKASRLLKVVEAGEPICVTVTLLDGLVVARSVFHNSMNYRSVVVLGQGRIVEDETAKYRALEVITDRILPGRWADTRLPTPKEMKATTVVALPIDEVSAKIRSGGPVDDDEDYDLDYWAGVVPLSQVKGTPEGDERLKAGLSAPDYL
jgi:hypothetical protein